MATEAKVGGGKIDKNFFVFVDGEKYVPPTPTMTPNDIIDQAAGLDPSTHYLIRTNRGHESFNGQGDVQISLEKADRFQVVSIGPTPVS